MPKKVFRMSEVLPQLVSKYRTVSPTELKEKILSDYNKDISSDAVRKFMQRNPQAFGALMIEIRDKDTKQIEVKSSLYENGTFSELNSIKKWNLDQATRVSPEHQKSQVDAIKNVCKGTFYLRIKTPMSGWSLEQRQIEGWTSKHPDRLTLEQAKEFLAAVHQAGRGTKNYRLALRAFFLSRDKITINPTDISGEMGELGKWKRVFVPKETLTKILEYVYQQNFDYGVADECAYKTGSRATATLEEFKNSNITTEEDGTVIMKVIDKGFHRKGRQTWFKIIPKDLQTKLDVLFLSHGDKAFGDINPDSLRAVNKEAYRKFLDGQALELALSEPMHFWRHMFAQHMLRATNWNYDLVAELGGWKGSDIIKKCYGAPTRELIRKAGLEAIPNI